MPESLVWKSILCLGRQLKLVPKDTSSTCVLMNYWLDLLISKLTVVPLISVPGVTVKSESVRSSCSERTSQSNRSEKMTLGSHGNSAFQPITANCKIIPQGQMPSPAESPGKSFQPITMSCKIVSGESHRRTKKVEKEQSWNASSKVLYIQSLSWYSGFFLLEVSIL